MDALQLRNSNLSGFRGAEYQRAIGVLHLEERTASGTAGGDFNSAAWRIRALNTILVNTIPGSVTGALPAITLPRGVYDVWAQAPAYYVNRHVIRLYDVTNAAVILPGVSAAAIGTTQTNSIIIGRFYLAAATQLQLEHQCQTTKAGDGFGLAMGGGFAVSTEVYATLSFWKVN